MDVLVKFINAVKAYSFFYVPLYLLPITAFWKFNKTKYKIFTEWQVWIFVGRGWLLLLYKSIRIFEKKKGFGRPLYIALLVFHFIQHRSPRLVDEKGNIIFGLSILVVFFRLFLGSNRFLFTMIIFLFSLSNAVNIRPTFLLWFFFYHVIISPLYEITEARRRQWLYTRTRCA